MEPDARHIAEQIGVDPGAITDAVLLSDRHGHRVWRLAVGGRPRILKWFADEPTAAAEVGGYRLLRELAVPTLPLYAGGNQTLLLEDLDSSRDWRLADEADLRDPAVGEAVGEWYRTLHARGEECLASGRPRPVFLARESDGLDSGAVLAIGRALGSPENRVWRLAADQVRLLRQAEASLSVTLTYNDFYWTNLAVSRSEGGARRAIVFDYHLLGIGTRYSDYRNVTGSLGEAAGRAFHETYGEFDPREQVIDRPLSVLYSLAAGTSMPEFPVWAEDSRQRAASGGLERDLAEAIELARRLVAPTAPPL